VSEQLPALAGRWVQFERQMIGVEAAIASQYKNTERVIGDDAVKLLDPRFLEMLW
jgi:hypothetical protein